MPRYQLSKDAVQDLRDVAKYAIDTWGRNELQKYRLGLKDIFLAITKNEVLKRAFSDAFPDLMVTKFRYHYIFYLAEPRQKPIIIGIIHEKRDIVHRLAERLS